MIGILASISFNRYYWLTLVRLWSFGFIVKLLSYSGYDPNIQTLQLELRWSRRLITRSFLVRCHVSVLRLKPTGFKYPNSDNRLNLTSNRHPILPIWFYNRIHIYMYYRNTHSNYGSHLRNSVRYLFSENTYIRHFEKTG